MNDWIGLTVSEVLRRCKASYADVELIDEPPGKLRSIRFLCREVEPPRQVVLDVEYGSASFSKARSWPRMFVENLKIVKVHEFTDRSH